MYPRVALCICVGAVSALPPSAPSNPVSVSVSVPSSCVSQEQIQILQVKLPDGWSQPKRFYESNKIDVHLCGIMFWCMGGRVSREPCLVSILASVRVCRARSVQR